MDIQEKYYRKNNSYKITGQLSIKQLSCFKDG